MSEQLNASEPVSQQDSIPENDATKAEMSPNMSTEAPPPPVEDMLAKCLIVFYLKEGRTYENEINIYPSKIESVRNAMLQNMEKSKEGDVLCVQGSALSPVDFCILPIKNISHIQFLVKEIVKIKKD